MFVRKGIKRKTNKKILKKEETVDNILDTNIPRRSYSITNEKDDDNLYIL